MNFYLSSFGIGRRPGTLRRLAGGQPLGFVPNAVDHLEASPRRESNSTRMQELRDLGVAVEVLDLGEYFGAPERLEARMGALGGVWVRGGNAFVLRRAMRMSGFERLIARAVPPGFLYGGYSAGICVLGPTLRGLDQVDDPHVSPYPGRDVIWDGLGLLEHLILPHYRSDHPESPAIDEAVEYCSKEGIPFRTLGDGDTIVIEDGAELVGDDEP